MKENHLLITFIFFEPKTQNKKLKYLIWLWEEGHGGYMN
jgi:hypothetical protein